MNRALQIIALTGLAVMLLSCGPSGTGTGSGQAAQVAPTSNPSVETQAPTDTPLPAPTSTVAPPTSTPEATAMAAAATATDSPPEAIVPSATPLTVRSPGDVLRISPAQAKALLDRGRAMLYDARSADQYRALHAAGAVSFPEAEATARLDELSEDQALIFYCT